MLEDACLLEDERLTVRAPLHKEAVVIHHIAPKHNRRAENLVWQCCGSGSVCFWTFWIQIWIRHYFLPYPYPSISRKKNKKNHNFYYYVTAL